MHSAVSLYTMHLIQTADRLHKLDSTAQKTGLIYHCFHVAFNEAEVPAFESQPLVGLHADPLHMPGELGSSHVATGRDAVQV